MIRWALYKVDHLIHKVIPHPPCEKAHLANGGYIPFSASVNTGYPATTVNTGYTTVRYTNFP